MLLKSESIDNHSIDKDVVSVGRTVTFKELPDEEEEAYTIVGATEADPMSGKISNESPIAAALLGHKVDEEVTIKIPSGDMHVKITKVEE